jgi:hypothetical protein
LKVSDENSRIRIHWSETWIRGSESTPKCHGSATLLRRTVFIPFISGSQPRCEERVAAAVQVSRQVLPRGCGRGAHSGYHAQALLPTGTVPCRQSVVPHCQSGVRAVIVWDPDPDWIRI